MIPYFFLKFHLWPRNLMEFHWTCYFLGISPPWSTCTPNTHAHRTGVKIIPKVAIPMKFHQGSFFCDEQRWTFKKKQGIMITRKISQYMTLYECPEHVDLSIPCLIILVTMNSVDIVWYYGVGVPQWKNWSWMPSTCGLTHPLINHSDLIWVHARGPKQIETVYHGPTAPFPWTCSAWDGAFGLQQCCPQLCKNLAVHAGSSSRNQTRTRSSWKIYTRYCQVACLIFGWGGTWVPQYQLCFLALVIHSCKVADLFTARP